MREQAAAEQRQARSDKRRRIVSRAARVTAGSVHEASHACVAIELHVGFRKVDIIRRGNVSGALFESRVIFPSDDQIERSIIVGFAGGLAEHRFAPRSNWARAMGGLSLAGTDLDRIDARLRMLGRHGDAAYRAELEARAAALVKKLYPEIKFVAAALLKRKVLTQAQVKKLMADARKGKFVL
jgi:hypothetical protein